MPRISSHDLEHLRKLPTQKERRRAFRHLALVCHPDKVAATENKEEATRYFQELLAACNGDENLTETQPESVGVDCARLCALQQRDVVHGVAFSPSRRTVAACGDSGRVVIWNALDGCAEEGWRFAEKEAEAVLDADVSGPGTALAVAFLDGGQHLAVALGTSVVIWEVALPSEPKFRFDVEARALALAVNLQNGWLAAGTEAGMVWTWKWESERAHCGLEAKLKHTPVVECVTFGCEGALLVAGGGGSRLSLWRQSSKAWRRLATLGSWRCPEVIYSVDAVWNIIAAGGTGATVPVWTSLAKLPKRKSTDSTACDDDDEGDAASSDGSSSCFLSDHDDSCDFESDEELLSPDVFITHASDDTVAVNAVSICPSARRLATGGSDCRILLWQLPSLSVLATFVHRLPLGGCNLATATINHLQISLDGAVLAAGGYDMVLTVWRLPGPTPIQDAGQQ